MGNSAIKGRNWYFAGGALSLLIGILAMARPGLASVAIADIVGLFLLVSGIVMLGSALFGRTEKHRFLDYFSAALRLVVGLLLIVKVVQGVMALTLLLAVIFIAEGVFGTLFAIRMRGKNPAWIWILANAVVAFVLGGMLLAEFPSDAAWAVGLLFGINSAFLGLSLIMFAVAIPRAKVV